MYKPRVKRVAPELKVEVRELISAANITAISIPRSPAGIKRSTKVGYAILEQAILESQIFLQLSGLTNGSISKTFK